jgi:hypothetical protein
MKKSLLVIAALAFLLCKGFIFSQKSPSDPSAALTEGQGWLVVSAAINGESAIPAHHVRYWIFPKERPNDLVDSALIGSPAGEEIAVPKDIYTVKVRYLDVVGKPFLSKEDIHIRDGDRVDVAFDIQTAGIRIMAASGKGPLYGFQQVKVWIYEHPEEIEYGFYGTVQDQAGLAVDCLPGLYDIKVEYSSATDRPVIWDRQINLSAGDHVTRSYTFPQGEIVLSVKAPGGEAVTGWTRVRYWIYNHAGGHEVAYGTVERPEGQSIFLQPGMYDIKAQYAGVKGSPEKWLMGVEVVEGRTAAGTIQFTTATLKLRAEAFGRSLYGWREISYRIVESPGNQQVAYGTLEPDGDEILIMEGTYDIKFQFYASENKQSEWVRDVDLKDGEVRAVSIRFSAGYLDIEALAGNRPLHGWKDIRLWIRAHPAGKEIFSGTLKKGPERNRFVLMEGRYDLKAQYMSGGFSPVKDVRDIVIRDGETTKVRVEFSE